jgi:DNA polymerase I-like protein with 3'-5' exonuclease and polymerase domains
VLENDKHTRQAAAIFGIAYDAVTRDQREWAKAYGFWELYGITVKDFAYTVESSQCLPSKPKAYVPTNIAELFKAHAERL